MLSIGSRIKELRIEKNLTQDELANNLNKKFNAKVNKGMVSKWESNSSEPRLEYTRNIAEYFDVSLDFLIGVTKDKGCWASESKENKFSEKDIITMAAHKVGHEGDLSDEELEKVKLALKIALMKNDN